LFLAALPALLAALTWLVHAPRLALLLLVRTLAATALLRTTLVRILVLLAALAALLILLAALTLAALVLIGHLNSFECGAIPPFGNEPLPSLFLMQ
jgi:hypothetical protein